MSYTVREIMEKFTNGIPLPIHHKGQGLEDPTFNDYDETSDPDFGLVEAQQMAQSIQHSKNQRFEKIKEKEQLKAQATAERLKKFHEWERKQVVEKETNEPIAK